MTYSPKTLGMIVGIAIISLVSGKYTLLYLHGVKTLDDVIKQLDILYVFIVVSKFFIIIGAVVLGSLFTEHMRKKNNTEYSQKR